VRTNDKRRGDLVLKNQSIREIIILQEGHNCDLVGASQI